MEIIQMQCLVRRMQKCSELFKEPTKKKIRNAPLPIVVKPEEQKNENDELRIEKCNFFYKKYITLLISFNKDAQSKVQSLKKKSSRVSKKTFYKYLDQPEYKKQMILKWEEETYDFEKCMNYYRFIGEMVPLCYCPRPFSIKRKCLWNELTSQHELICPEQIFYRDQNGISNFMECVGVTFLNLGFDDVVDRNYFKNAPLLKSFEELMKWKNENPHLIYNTIHLWMNQTHSYNYETFTFQERPEGEWVEYYRSWKIKLGYYTPENEQVLKTKRINYSWFEGNICADIFQKSNKVSMISIPCSITNDFWEDCEIVEL